MNNTNNSIKNDLSLNIEDLIMIEDKFSKLIKTVNDHNINIVNKTCYEWWNYYFNCSLKGNCDYLFSEPRNKNVIACYNSLLLISIMLIYDLSFQPKLFLKLIDFLKNVLFINHQNYLNICQYLISRIKQEYLSSKWVEQLIKITSSQVSKKKLYIYELDQNLQSLNKILSTIILNLNSTHQIINPKIELIYKNFIQYEAETINKIFMTDIIQIDNKGGSLLFSEKKYNNPIINNFFLSKNPIKPISLVLDLDETLMSFVYTDNEKKEGLSRLRPFLYNFLNLVKEYYEIITFTAATQSYADPILDAIEIKRGKYFNFRLYRNHCSIVNNIIVKDISLIGRDISKIIIVDNMQQNFKLQKENGILISSFWGEDSNDKALLQLGRILVTIATEMIGNNYCYDIRALISKYKDDILKNVSMN
jgi:CTD small phosphatase-like protein 2